MFKIESYVTPILLSYVDKYVRDFKPADAQVSLWGGGVALHNLVLKADVLQQEMALPFTLVSGRIHELLIQVPWTKIMSEPIVVTIDTIECVLSLNPPTGGDDIPPPESPRTQLVEAPPGYMQAVVRRIVSNIALRVHHLIVKYVQDDMVLSLNVKRLSVDSADADWEPAFADIEAERPLLRRVSRLEDVTLCLDRADADGKIRLYQEPLLYRCHLDLRILTRLLSVHTRRATSLSVQVRSSKLAWGVTNDQLTLLLRLLRERSPLQDKPPTPAPRTSSATLSAPLHATSSNSAEPARNESWSEWAWSWLPARAAAPHEPARPAQPVPLRLALYCDHVTLLFKVMENEGSSRRRARGVLEVAASHAALKSEHCRPTALRGRLAARRLTVLARGHCVCGHAEHAMSDEPTVYLCKEPTKEDGAEAWQWPADDIDVVVEPALVAEEQYRPTPEPQEIPPPPGEQKASSEQRDEDLFWRQMAPQVLLEFTHERSPPDATVNPYDAPPVDFQYSDWVEECDMKITVEPSELRVCTGLLHRLTVFYSVCTDLPPVPQPDVAMRTLTVEECEALSDNLPQRRVRVQARGLSVRVLPGHHARAAPLLLQLHMPRNTLMLNGPLYPHRVCSAACQMPDDTGNLWQGARLHVTLDVNSFQANICTADGAKARPCARFDMRAVVHVLLNKQYFAQRESVYLGYTLRIREANVCGSSARLQAAWQVPYSLATQQMSALLKHTSLASDALNDEESVVIDLTIEELAVRGYYTNNVITHVVTLQSAKATVLHDQKTSELKQAWLFSFPDAPTTTPFLRCAVQWCAQPLPGCPDYAGVWTEPTALAVDPLLIAWLAYKPTIKPPEFTSSTSSIKSNSSQYFIRRRVTPPSSSGRGASKTGSGTELIHSKPRSVGSSEKVDKDPKQSPSQNKPSDCWFGHESILRLHERLRHTLVNTEVGLTVLYVTMSTASALDCATLRDAMERHASLSHRVLALSFGRFTIYSSTLKRNFWNDIRHDGPTYIKPNPETPEAAAEQFPWRLRLADVSCYTLEARAGVDQSGRDTGLRSRLKTPCTATPRTVLELVTTIVTLSVVTKSLPMKIVPKKEPKIQPEPVSVDEERIKYFTKGMSFKPSTLKEFVRGPANKKKEKKPEEPEPKAENVSTSYEQGPLVSLGVNVHADTPPLILRLDHDQVHIVVAAAHCFAHLLALLRRPPLLIPSYSQTSLGGSQRSLIRSVSELDEGRSPSDESPSENRSELISIFEAPIIRDSAMFRLKTFFWFQWVVSRVTLIAATHQVKLALHVDDIISTVDLQDHYNQLKVKVASASVRHYERSGAEEGEWAAGELGGRVLEVREPANSKDDNHFLTVTVTQARISNLPASWKEELHPKLLEKKSSVDSVWEVYTRLAPLEAVLQPKVLEHVVSLAVQMAPRASCPLSDDTTHSQNVACNWHWPFLYVTWGGLRLLLRVDHDTPHLDDTFMFVIGKVIVSPHPENPICRRAINPGAEGGWQAAAGHDGRQYELVIKNLGLRVAKFCQLVTQETSAAEMNKGTAGENPALKWSQPVEAPLITPLLHNVDVECVWAPAVMGGGRAWCGPALELNLASDCALELSLAQVQLAHKLLRCVARCLRLSEDEAMAFDEEKHGVCPYASLLMQRASDESVGDGNPLVTDKWKSSAESMGRVGADSGLDSAATSTLKYGRHHDDPGAAKKAFSVVFADHLTDASDYLEVFVTMGAISVSLYVVDDGSPDVVALRPPPDWQKHVHHNNTVSREEETHTRRATSSGTHASGTKSLTESVRHEDTGKTKLDQLPCVFPSAIKSEANLPLVHITLHQPNLYYWRKKTQRSVQVSLFDAWLGVGAAPAGERWSGELLRTARGRSDPLTDIPPALATLSVTTHTPVSSCVSSAMRGTIKLDVERPVSLDVSCDKLRRLLAIGKLVKQRISFESTAQSAPSEKPVKVSPLYAVKRLLVEHCIESVTVQTTQMAVSGSQGAAGWGSLAAQLGASARPGRLTARALLSAAAASAGRADHRHALMQPAVIGLELEASWEAWRRAESGLSGCEPSLRLALELDCVTLDLRPADLHALAHIRVALAQLARMTEAAAGSDDVEATSARVDVQSSEFDPPPSTVSVDNSDEHYYKDDLRSGAFKIVSGGQAPMAYQVTLHNSAVSWRYPHPRAVTRLVAYPLPGQDEETPCVLELYNQLLGRWETHTYFAIPVDDARDFQLHVPSPECAYAVMWRFRAYDGEDPDTPFEFDVNKFLPRPDPLVFEWGAQQPCARARGVSAEQLAGGVRVDSSCSPRLAPRVQLLARAALLTVYLHNDLPPVPPQNTAMEGYYVSKPHRLSHRALSACVRDASVHALLASPAGQMYIMRSQLESDIFECATGTMEPLVRRVRAQAAVSQPAAGPARARLAAARLHAALTVPRLRTLRALADDWTAHLHHHTVACCTGEVSDEVSAEDARPVLTEQCLEGRVALFVHNRCSVALRLAQDDTDAIVPLAPAAKLTYRWHSPAAPKQLRFERAGPSADWSTSIPFTVGNYVVRLNEPATDKPGGGVHLYARVEQTGARRTMRLTGRLCLANMLRCDLLYKVRGRSAECSQWMTVCGGDMPAETIGTSVLCAADCDMTLKIKFVSNETGWSGDIPLKECPKENVPWLVKVPSDEGQVSYVSVWCRVVRARADGRVLATVWPLYVLYSQLPLDTDVLISSEWSAAEQSCAPPPLVQAAPGRGACTHLLAPGTTAARHTLSFQYTNIECPVTKDAVPLHYGVTDTSVFDKRAPVATLDDIIHETQQWIDRCGRDAVSEWPYSIVRRHWPHQWKPALLQPRCDVIVRYSAVRAGGGCALQTRLSPAVLLANAAPAALTLRAHDAAPLCRLDPGTAIAPPSALIHKPFFISVESGRETFVSGELAVSSSELGQYGSPPPGRVALDHAVELAVHCNHKVALLTMYYEIIEDINVLGITSTYTIINRLDCDIMVSCMAIPHDAEDDVTLTPTSYKFIPPTPKGSVQGAPLCRFSVWRGWRGRGAAELRLYASVAVAGGGAAPVRLARAPARRPLAATHPDRPSMAIVVTQVKHEGRWVITVAQDPCPQFLIYNHTDTPLLVGQPASAGDEPSTSKIMVLPECEGVRWFASVGAHECVHYSSPTHARRYPPAADAAPPPALTFLTFAPLTESGAPAWCAGVAAAAGEQLLQLAGGRTLKLQLRAAHAHSATLHLRDVDHRDIAARDVRRRLLGAFSSEEIQQYTSEFDSASTGDLGKTDVDEKQPLTLGLDDVASSLPDNEGASTETASIFQDDNESALSERVRVWCAAVAVELGGADDARPLLALHADHAALYVRSDCRRTKTSISIADVQVDNLQYESGQFDFAVVAATRAEPAAEHAWPTLWNMFAEQRAFVSRRDARALLKLTHDSWTVANRRYTELTEVEASLGPLALYIEDEYVKALACLARAAFELDVSDASVSHAELLLAEERALCNPLRLQLLHIHPLHLTLTLHTAVRMYIALDQSPLRLGAFRLSQAMTSPERLTQALTVHYLSAAILGAGWVVGGLELLGAPGAVAARVGGARGGVRGVAAAAAAALLRSLSAWAGSLARNLDLLAGDEEHSARAAAARRRAPHSLAAGLAAGLTNFAINILGAVGGLAHHPLVGVAVGESGSAAALRRGLVGALAKPLSATADLVAYAGHGLLHQTGWDPVPQPRVAWGACAPAEGGWRRDCVRWAFRLAALSPLAGYRVLMDAAPVLLVVTHDYLVVVEPESERVIEMIDFKSCSVGPYQGQTVELVITQRRQSKLVETRVTDEDDEVQVSAAAMARVARYTGATGGAASSAASGAALRARRVALEPAAGMSRALHAALLAAAARHDPCHLPLL